MRFLRVLPVLEAHSGFIRSAFLFCGEKLPTFLLVFLFTRATGGKVVIIFTIRSSDTLSRNDLSLHLLEWRNSRCIFQNTLMLYLFLNSLRHSILVRHVKTTTLTTTVGQFNPYSPLPWRFSPPPFVQALRLSCDWPHRRRPRTEVSPLANRIVEGPVTVHVAARD